MTPVAGWHYVFWRHDQYPYVMGGVVKEIVPGTCGCGASEVKVRVCGYDGLLVRPLKFLPPEEGQALREQLSDLHRQFAAAERTFKAEWMDRVYAAVPFGIGR